MHVPPGPRVANLSLLALGGAAGSSAAPSPVTCHQPQPQVQLSWNCDLKEETEACLQDA